MRASKVQVEGLRRRPCLAIGAAAIAALMLRGPSAYAGPQKSIFVSDEHTLSIKRFPIKHSGDLAPKKTIEGKKTRLDEPEQIFVDTNGKIWSPNYVTDTITEYSGGADGNVKPINTLAGAATGLSVPNGVAVDAQGKIFVANNGDDSIRVFAAHSKGNMAPVAVIQGGSTGLGDLHGIALDSSDDIWVPTGDFEQVEEFVVPYRIDEAGPRPLNLMRKAAGADHRDLDVPGIAVDSTADRPPKLPQSPGRGQRMLDDVDRKWNDRRRPRPVPQ